MLPVTLCTAMAVVSETSDTTTDELLAAADTSLRRVLKAEWNGEPYNHYCMALECGHHAHGSESYLCWQVLCRECLKETLGITAKRIF